jgi:predicted dehydrogenase
MNQNSAIQSVPAFNGMVRPSNRKNLLRGAAVVGLGYWGPNWIRNLSQLRSADRVVACDMDRERRDRIAGMFPNIETYAALDEVIEDPDIEAVVVATPVNTHYPIALKLLEAGKSVLIEKPLATSREEGEDLVRVARRNKAVLMVGHTFEYSSPVLKLSELISAGELGEIFYITSVRANLGLFQRDVNVAWDLATHDISIILMVMGRMPEAVSCQGRSHYRPGVEDVAMLELHFAGNVIAFVHVSWLDPNKIRRMTIVGSRKMLVYDDTDPHEKVRIYDKGVSVQRYYDSYADFQLSYRYGDVHSPRIEEVEPLKAECEHFIDCVLNDKTPKTDGLVGIRVVSVLEAASQSLKNGGTLVEVSRPAID